MRCTRHSPYNTFRIDDEGRARVGETKQAFACVICLAGFALGITQDRVLPYTSEHRDIATRVETYSEIIGLHKLLLLHYWVRADADYIDFGLEDSFLYNVQPATYDTSLPAQGSETCSPATASLKAHASLVQP